jgi:hypothetical protein
MSTFKCEVGDVVVCWRPSVFLPAYYLAKVLRKCVDRRGNPALYVKPLHGVFRFPRLVNGIFLEGGDPA